MAKDDQQEAFERMLSANLARVLDFVKFAEGKNAALLAFCSAWIVASVNLLTGQNALPPEYRSAFAVALALFSIAALMCVTSFLPRISLERFHKRSHGAKSLLFFGDLATLETATVKERLLERYMPQCGQSATHNYLEDLSVQIAVNSRIAKRKFRMFSMSAFFVLVAIGALSVPPLRSTLRLAGDALSWTVR
jgi:hypothetical protein